MSLRPEPIEPVPEETARIARLAFPRGSTWLRLHDELGTIYEDEAFAPLFPTHGRPAEAESEQNRGRLRREIRPLR